LEIEGDMAPEAAAQPFQPPNGRHLDTGPLGDLLVALESN
jgi:hypothetical protein